jgi:hypothetical protein
MAGAKKKDKNKLKVFRTTPRMVSAEDLECFETQESGLRHLSKISHAAIDKEIVKRKKAFKHE